MENKSIKLSYRDPVNLEMLLSICTMLGLPRVVTFSDPGVADTWIQIEYFYEADTLHAIRYMTEMAEEKIKNNIKLLHPRTKKLDVQKPEQGTSSGIGKKRLSRNPDILEEEINETIFCRLPVLAATPHQVQALHECLHHFEGFGDFTGFKTLYNDNELPAYVLITYRSRNSALLAVETGHAFYQPRFSNHYRKKDNKGEPFEM